MDGLPPTELKPKPPSIAERLARRYASKAAGQLTYGLLLLVLIPVVVAIAVPIFVVLGVVVFGSYALLGEPDPPLGSVFSLGWFFGSLLLLFLVLRLGHRWITRLIAMADAPAVLIDPYRDQELVEARRPTGWSEAPDQIGFRERVAAADARHTPPSASLEAPPVHGEDERDGDPSPKPLK